MDCTENTTLHRCSSIVATGTCFFVKPLLSNGCCIFAYLTVIAQQHATALLPFVCQGTVEIVEVKNIPNVFHNWNQEF
jgi:hypothetical protein